MKCTRHPEYEIKNLFGECNKCAEEERQDYEKLKESISRALKESEILKHIKKDSR